MGQAARPAHRVIVTSDNPRCEAPADIAREILEGLHGTGAEVELDRATAIRRAVVDARANDTVLVCGKGHETEQIIGGDVRPFSDVEVILEAARTRA